MLYLSEMVQIAILAEEKCPLDNPSALPDKQTNYLYRNIDEVKVQLLICILDDLYEFIKRDGHQSRRSETCDGEKSAVGYY